MSLDIAKLRRRFRRQGNPVISVDAKKRELVGNFKNPGAKWDRTPAPVNDHDFRSLAKGIAISYGIYDPQANRGTVIVGTSDETSAFAVSSICQWWDREGANATLMPANCSSWPTPAAATRSLAALGRPHSATSL